VSKFKLADYSSKEITISGPWELTVLIDFDDVDHRAVKKDAKKLIELLNNNWQED
jgi:hypothetical protein